MAVSRYSDPICIPKNGIELRSHLFCLAPHSKLKQLL